MTKTTKKAAKTAYQLITEKAAEQVDNAVQIYGSALEASGDIGEARIEAHTKNELMKKAGVSSQTAAIAAAAARIFFA